MTRGPAWPQRRCGRSRTLRPLAWVKSAMEALPDPARADVAAAAMQALPVTAKADATSASARTLPDDAWDDLIQRLVPDQAMTNDIWKWLVRTFAGHACRSHGRVGRRGIRVIPARDRHCARADASHDLHGDRWHSQQSSKSTTRTGDHRWADRVGAAALAVSSEHTRRFGGRSGRRGPRGRMRRGAASAPAQGGVRESTRVTTSGPGGQSRRRSS
jgi:hypothetical protein